VPAGAGLGNPYKLLNIASIFTTEISTAAERIVANQAYDEVRAGRREACETNPGRVRDPIEQRRETAIKRPARNVWTKLLPVPWALLTGACGLKDSPLLDAKGPIALAERELLLVASAVMLLVIVPVIVMTFWFAWRYRASNTRARYTPAWTYSGKIDAVVWAIPAVIVLVLGVLVWTYTHRLDPYKRLDPTQQRLEVQAIAQDWKWLFLYPAQGIATVNELAFPSGMPLNLQITSDTVMNAFSIPALGGQIYAMAGMRTKLNLLADAPGRFVGRNTQYSGRGFSQQQFTAVAMTRQDFDDWIAKVKQSPNVLDAAAYERLTRPSTLPGVARFSSYKAGLFEDVIAKYTARGAHVAEGKGQ
jgi:cytochrome o ubiquinol oxidase subunit 2